METRVKMWGNSLAVRIPKPLAAEVGLESDSPVEISLVDNRLIVMPLVEPKWTLESLLAKVTDENLHGELDFGPAVGNEIW